MILTTYLHTIFPSESVHPCVVPSVCPKIFQLHRLARASEIAHYIALLPTPQGSVIQPKKISRESPKIGLSFRYSFMEAE